MAFAEGFTRGFGLMDAHYARKDQKERLDRQEDRQKMLDRRDAESHGLSMELNRENLANAKETRDIRNKTWDRTQQDWVFQDEEREHTRERRKVTEDQADRLNELNIEGKKTANQKGLVDIATANENLATAKVNRINALAERAFQNVANDMVTDADIKFWKDHPEFDPIKITGFDTGHVISVLNDAANPETKTNMNDPQVIQAANVLFYSDLQKGEGKDKRIIAAYPGKKPGTLVFKLGVKGKDGEYEAPMTVGRGSDKNAEVMQVPITKLLDRIQGTQFVREALLSPEFAPKLEKLKSRYAPTKPKDLPPETKARVEYLQKVIESETKKYEAAIAAQPLDGKSADNPELTAIKDNISNARQTLESLLGIKMTNGTGGNVPGNGTKPPPPNSFEEAVTTIMGANQNMTLAQAQQYVS